MYKSTEITNNDIDNLEFELQRQAKKESNKTHYVNNKQLFQEFVKYNKIKKAKKSEHLEQMLSDFSFLDVEQVEEQPLEMRIEFQRALKTFTAPPLTDIMGQAILDISYRRCYSPRFVNYAPNWKEEMISDAIETCVKYAHNFDPEKYDNPFAYLTQLVTNAIFQRIKKEHKQQYIKLKLFDDSHGFVGEIDENNVNNEDMELLDETNDMYKDRLNYIDNYEEIQGLNKTRAKRKKKGDGDSILDMIESHE
jgi:hypothetical protein